MIVGVLAVQGDFAEHVAVLEKLGAEVVEVRLPRDLNNLSALIIPGGESTTQRRLLDLYELTEPIRSYANTGKPVWGTCAGMIILARALTDDRPEPLKLMDILVSRNAYGRQVDSFETDLICSELGPEPYRAVFIRAPLVVQILNDEVVVLSELPDGTPVAVRQGNLLATSFHPELTSDVRFHKYFLGLVDPNCKDQ
ncbi:pyridoxal 5'-phosphate synthase glutaminase subunit PdxT [SAR202 cluster bacterium AD-804-J14_MRT_500m]|nr:pyridoxal 5'-phosphate synthase glutaminase subunit PdxT [SAR202 cluster bacterium AD-804-J14_MRT_500m]